MNNNFPATVMVPGIIINKGDFMPPELFSQCRRINVDVYQDLLERVVKPRIVAYRMYATEDLTSSTSALTVS